MKVRGLPYVINIFILVAGQMNSSRVVFLMLFYDRLVRFSRHYFYNIVKTLAKAQGINSTLVRHHSMVTVPYMARTVSI